MSALGHVEQAGPAMSLTPHAHHGPAAILHRNAAAVTLPKLSERLAVKFVLGTGFL